MGSQYNMNGKPRGLIEAQSETWQELGSAPMEEMLARMVKGIDTMNTRVGALEHALAVLAQHAADQVKPKAATKRATTSKATKRGIK